MSAQSMNSIAIVCLTPEMTGTKKAESKCVRRRTLKKQVQLSQEKLGSIENKNSPSINKLRNDQNNLSDLAPSGQVCHGVKPAGII